MKKKTIEAMPAIPATADGWCTTVQIIKDTIVLNIHQERELKWRHCFVPETKEYATYDVIHGRWNHKRITFCYGVEYESAYGYNEIRGNLNERSELEASDQKTVYDMIEVHDDHWRKREPEEWARIISDMETKGKIEERECAELRRVKRVKAMMARVPDKPEDLQEWVSEKLDGGRCYCLKDQETGKWTCTACGRQLEKIQGKPKNKDEIICPECGKTIVYLSRKRSVDAAGGVTVVQPIDEEVSVVRHFWAAAENKPNRQRKVWIGEQVRIILFKSGSKEYRLRNWKCDIYYQTFRDEFDNKGNNYNIRMVKSYLYDDGIAEAFRGTVYDPWTKLFTEFAAAGLELEYNKMMCMHASSEYRGLIEMLYRGRFYKLLRETSENVGGYTRWSYTGMLHPEGNSIESVFGISDRQKINRIRDRNGGELMLDWMRESDEEGFKVSEKVLDWLEQVRLWPGAIMDRMTEYMSLEQSMNYLIRQKKEQYQGRTVRSIIEQYADYISMCKKLKKDMTDEMVYRPRELKRRHDEAVEEIKAREEELQAEEYSEKFGEAEQVMQEVRSKFEYTGQAYRILVPRRIVDIVKEGRALHHCAGATDRYFDRIKNHETYICFLRKNEAPDEPFYTIEVEPGGTIRQHRGMFDEEPDIELVKPFLREWQKVIRKRMKAEDHERAAASKLKREENIEDLKQKNNTRVLAGLMEDFMEAVG